MRASSTPVPGPQKYPRPLARGQLPSAPRLDERGVIRHDADHVNRSSSVRSPRPRPRATAGAPRIIPAVAAERARRALADPAAVERLARTFKALGDPGRSKLVLALSVAELCVSDLAHVLGASLSATSHQLRILRELDIVRVRRLGKSQLYALNEQAFGFCSPRLCQAWKQTLDRTPLVRPPGAA
jgi:DNA-binding transcriptional ArsR family regulator